jgi:hypothetical protein
MDSHRAGNLMETAELLLAHLHTYGVLLQHDKALPSLSMIVAGEPVRGSWWAHPKAHTMYALLNTITAHPDVLVIKLVLGKVTFIHRRLWPAVLAIACAHESWQFAGLSDQARALYELVELQGVLRATGAHAKELERRLLVQSAQVHTESGHHELQLTQWALWAEQVNCARALTAQAGRLQLASAVQAIGGTYGILPWEAKPVAG